jgi:hypothetical protein
VRRPQHRHRDVVHLERVVKCLFIPGQFRPFAAVKGLAQVFDRGTPLPTNEDPHFEMATGGTELVAQAFDSDDE